MFKTVVFNSSALGGGGVVDDDDDDDSSLIFHTKSEGQHNLVYTGLLLKFCCPIHYIFSSNKLIYFLRYTRFIFLKLEIPK